MDIKARELKLRLHPGAYVHVLPSEAGHVGADNVAVLIAEEPHHQNENLLGGRCGDQCGNCFRQSKSGCTAPPVPTGPAFEGAQIAYGVSSHAREPSSEFASTRTPKQARFRVIGDERWSNEWQLGSAASPDEQPKHLAVGICGSGIIEVVAEMYLTGILQPDGRFNTNIESDRIQWDGRKGDVYLSYQRRVR